MENKLYIKAFAEKAKNGKITFVATDETKDRYGDIIPMTNWDLKEYKKAPRLLVDHDHRVEKIVGKATNLRITKEGKSRMLFEPEFHGITELSRQVEQMVQEGHLNTVSVGFIPHAPEEKAKAKDGNFQGRNELIEISFVTVPANPNAHAIKGLIDQTEKREVVDQVNNFMAKTFTGEVEIKSTEIQTLVFSKKQFSKDSAFKWIEDHAFRSNDFEETDTSYRFKQFSEDQCQEQSERSVSLEVGVKAITCKQNKGICVVNDEIKYWNDNETQDRDTVNLMQDKMDEFTQKITDPNYFKKNNGEVSPVINDVKRHKGTHRKREGRSVRKQRTEKEILRAGLKEAVKVINFHLLQSKKRK